MEDYVYTIKYIPQKAAKGVNIIDILQPKKIGDYRAKFIATSGLHHSFIDFNDDVYVFGSNSWNELGLGMDVLKIDTPRKVPNIKAKMVACGMYHTLILDINGNIWVAGINPHHQLGLNNNRAMIGEFIKLQNIQAKFIAAGGDHSLFIDNNDDLYGFGKNDKKQLGSYAELSTPKPVKIISRCRTASCSVHCTAAIDMYDNLYIMGVIHYYSHRTLEYKQPTMIPNIKAQAVNCGIDNIKIIGTVIQS